MIKKAIRGIVAILLIAVFWVAGSGMNIYHFCCEACAHQCLEFYFGLTDCQDVHTHHHCHEHDCYCEHHHHDADEDHEHDCEHLERHSNNCSLTRICNDNTLPTDVLTPSLPIIDLVAAAPLGASAFNTISQQTAFPHPQHHAPPGGRDALKENCVLRI